MLTVVAAVHSNRVLVMAVNTLGMIGEIKESAEQCCCSVVSSLDVSRKSWENFRNPNCPRNLADLSMGMHSPTKGECGK